MTMGRCLLSIFCSRGTQPRKTESVKRENPHPQPQVYPSEWLYEDAAGLFELVWNRCPGVPLPPYWTGSESQHPYLIESVYEVVLQNSIPAQIRQRILYCYFYEAWYDRFLRE